MVNMKRSLSDFVFFVRSPRRFVREYVKLPLAKFIYDTVDIYKARTKNGVDNVRDILLRGTAVAFITALLVWLSIFMYISFYYAYVPSLTHDNPVNLKFKPCKGWAIHRSVCSFPVGDIQLSAKQQTLMSGQPYKIFLDLEMPESPTNKDLGMFMICAEFYGADKSIITKSCKSAMLHYRSILLDTAMKIFFGPFYLFGNMEEKQNVLVELFSSYVESDNLKVSDIHIEIQTKHIEIYSAKFTILANFSGLRYVMFHWPIISAAVGITANLIFVALVSMISWYQIVNSEEYLEYLKEQEEKERVKENRRKIALTRDSTSEEDDDVSLIASDDIKDRGSSDC